MLQTYIKPHLSAAAREACGTQDELQFARLTVHLRAMGDWSDQEEVDKLKDWRGSIAPWFEFHQPGCDFYDDIMSGTAFGSPGFKSSLIVSEDDSNPCVSILSERYPGRVDAGSVGSSIVRDFCTLVSANFVVMSNSLFSKYVVLFNDRHPQVFLNLPRDISIYEGESWTELFAFKGLTCLDGGGEVWDTKVVFNTSKLQWVTGTR